jgi:hypothetical protein
MMHHIASRPKLRIEGINYQKGEQLAIYDPTTGDGAEQ